MTIQPVRFKLIGGGTMIVVLNMIVPPLFALHPQYRKAERPLPTVLPSCSQSCLLLLASTQGHTWKIEHKNRTHKYGRLLVDCFPLHNQAAPLSYNQ